MTAKRFTIEIIEDKDVFIQQKGANHYLGVNGYVNGEMVVDLLNELHGENEQLKTTMKEVTELLEEEVDLFSDKATEHDINAYVELIEFDNKDAYYMATSTKKSIKMLKEFLE